MQITATNKATNVSKEFDVNFKLTQLTDDARDANAMKSLVITFRARLLTVLNDTEITNKQKHVDAIDWVKVGSPHVRQTNVEKTVSMFDGLSRDDRIATLIHAGMSEKAATSIVDNVKKAA